MMKRRFLAVLTVFSLLFCVAPAQAASDVAESALIREVSVVDVARGELVANRDVLIRGRSIDRIAAGGTIEPPADARVIEGRGLYLMPGLFDAHVHITAGQGAFEPLLLAHGVVAVRDTGAPTDVVIDMRTVAAADGAIGPELIVTGAIIDGDPPIWPFSEACDTPEQARAAVDRLADAGVDQIKVYAMLKPEVHRAAVEQAKKHGLQVTGHVPFSMRLADVIDSGQNCIEHLDGVSGLLLELRPEQDEELRRRYGIFAGFWGWMVYEEVDHDELREVFRRMADKEVMQCPTLVVFDGLSRTLDEGAAADERLKYVPASLQAFWDRRNNESYVALMRDARPMMRRVVRKMHEAGVPMMIGSDLGNPQVFPGWGVHDEMSIFQKAGIPAADILRMATIAPAEFCGVDDRLGVIESGKDASFVLLRKNPLEDVAHAREIEAVFLRGRVFDREAIDGLFALAEELASGPTIAVDEVDLAPPGEVVHQGRFVMTFNEWNAGSERFVVTRDFSGSHVAGHVQPAGGGQLPTLTHIHFDEAGNFLRATWKQLTEPPVKAEYTVRDGQLIARGRRGDTEWETLEIDLPEGWVLSAPIIAADIVLTPENDLEPGEKHEVTFVSFGFPSWQPQTYPGEVERLVDTAMTITDDAGQERQIQVSRYAAVLRTPMGTMRSTVLFDEAGLIRDVKIDTGFGVLQAKYEQK